MSTGPFTFSWPVPSGGYTFVDVGVRTSGGHPVRVLVERDEPALIEYRRYDPLTSAPALFRDLADTRPTEEGILPFANKWGSLGVYDVTVGKTPLGGRRAELFTAWVQVISELRLASWLWNRLTAETPQGRLELGRRVLWEHDGQGRAQVVIDGHPRLPRTQTWTEDGYARVLGVLPGSQFIENELAMPARTFLCDLVNHNLAGRVSPRLLADSSPVMGSIKGTRKSASTATTSSVPRFE